LSRGNEEGGYQKKIDAFLYFCMIYSSYEYLESEEFFSECYTPVALIRCFIVVPLDLYFPPSVPKSVFTASLDFF
jgi:hypothetical protein